MKWDDVNERDMSGRGFMSNEVMKDRSAVSETSVVQWRGASVKWRVITKVSAKFSDVDV